MVESVDLNDLELDGIEDASEPSAVAAGQYIIRVGQAEFRNSKAGNPMLQLICELPDEPSAAGIFHFVMMPTRTMESDQKTRRKLELKRLLHAFSVPYTAAGFDPGALIGQECEMYVSVEQDDNGVDRNRLTPPPVPEGAKAPKGDAIPFE
tara:strand:+ start:120 stop:572 length:453 start_codon:yes stop_codon:yes gene_type:complete